MGVGSFDRCCRAPLVCGDLAAGSMAVASTPGNDRLPACGGGLALVVASVGSLPERLNRRPYSSDDEVRSGNTGNGTTSIYII